MTARKPLAALAALVLLVAAAPATADLEADIASAIEMTDLGGATIAVSVRNADTGAALVDIAGTRRMIPASNMKLLTTGTALAVLGADFSFRTRLLRDGDRLIVVGDGDPAFGDPELLALMPIGTETGLDVEAFLDLWVGPVARSDLDEVTELVVDDRIFDRELVHPGWPDDQLNRAYCAEVAGLNFHLNIVHLFPGPTDGPRPRLGAPVPDLASVELVNRATSRRGPRDTSNAWVARPSESNTLTVYGNVKFAYREPIRVTVHDVPTLFGRTLANRLERRGVRVGPVRRAADDDPLSRGTPIAPPIVTPIATVVTRCNRDSENLYAEALLKRAAAAVTRDSGTWRDGGAIVRQVVHERLREPSLTETVVVADGSGLGRGNRVSAALLTAWLASFHRDDDLGGIFIDSLARPGEDGTLRKRFADDDVAGTTVHAKSGYINGVSCLSGFVTAPDGRRRAFSILGNDLTAAGSVGRAKRLQERIVGLIAEDLGVLDVSMGSD